MWTFPLSTSTFGRTYWLQSERHMVTPGWVDLHTHVYWGVAPLGVDADANCLRRGVTTAVDAGSAGASTFAGFQRYVIDVAATRVVAVLHLSVIGMMRDDTARLKLDERFEGIRRALRQNTDQKAAAAIIPLLARAPRARAAG